MSDLKDLTPEELFQCRKLWDGAWPSSKKDRAELLQRAVAQIERQQAELATRRAEVERLKEEVATDNDLLAERQRILDVCPCPAHGACVPHVIDTLASLTAKIRAVEGLRDALTVKPWLDATSIAGELSAILTPPPSHYVLFPTDAFVQGGKQCFTFTGITACDPRTTFRDQTVAIRGQKWRVVSVETYAVPDPTGMNFGLIVEPLAQ